VLFVHLHLLVADGAWRQHPDGRVEFLPLRSLTDDDLHAVLASVHDDLVAADLDDPADVDPSLHATAQLSLSTAVPSEPRLLEPRLCVEAFDMNLHAASCVDGRDRKRLERVARYLLRPAFALDAITATDDGRVRLCIGRRGRAVTMTPHQLLAKLAALVPPPKVHLVRYHGVFANRHRLRAAIAPTPPTPAESPPRQLALLRSDGRPAWTARAVEDADTEPPSDVPRWRRLSWARLLARVFTTAIKCTRPRRRGASGLDHASVPPVAQPYLRSCR
jgi:hypothetical protein